MGFFDHLQSKGTPLIKPQVAKVKRETVKPDPGSSGSRSTAVTSRPKKVISQVKSNPQHRQSQSSASQTSDLNPERRPLKSKSVSKRSRVIQPLLSSSEESSSEELEDDGISSRKRIKTQRAAIDPTRRLQAVSSFTSGQEDVTFINAVDVASSKSGKKYSTRFKDVEGDPRVSLRYPGHPKTESFDLVSPVEAEAFNPIEEIVHTIEQISRNYMSADNRRKVLDESNGVVRHLKRSIARESAKDFQTALHTFNELIANLSESGEIAKNLDDMERPPLQLIECILTQVYARTVSLKVDTLRKYENGTDNVYGELLPRFVSEILTDSNLKSDQVFVDLGSGVANVVLQAALEVGCESWGCEMMENACVLADLQEEEFKARCALWGILPGEIHLERGDFLTNSKIGEALRQADVVLVNNQAFTPQLNAGLVNLFLDLKEGCQIVSLKSFVPQDHKITTRNINSPVNLLEVTQKHYYSNCVSWTNAPGTYFVARKDSSRLRSFERKLARRTLE